jgi:membrane protein implicated in regulation of membrane protease activity
VAIVIGVVVLIPSASFYALLAFAVWSIVVSILVYRRLREPAGASTVPQPVG